jgi:hypothetical protein
MLREIKVERNGRFLLKGALLLGLAILLPSCTSNPSDRIVYVQAPAPPLVITPAKAESSPPEEEAGVVCPQYGTAVMECTAQMMPSQSQPGWSKIFDACMTALGFPSKPLICMRGNRQMSVKAPTAQL